MEADINTVIAMLKQQRNEAMDTVAMLNGAIALKDKRIAELEAQLAEPKE
ncbi:MAG: hypothetical protein ACM3SS_17305 [Rhodospirillaceae bacterium]